MTKSKYNLVFWLRNAEVIKNLNLTKSLLVTIYAYEYHDKDYQLVFDIHILYINTNCRIRSMEKRSPWWIPCILHWTTKFKLRQIFPFYEYLSINVILSTTYFVAWIKLNIFFKIIVFTLFECNIGKSIFSKRLCKQIDICFIWIIFANNESTIQIALGQ